jgi:hypothetical protein
MRLKKEYNLTQLNFKENYNNSHKPSLHSKRLTPIDIENVDCRYETEIA